jgi:hypothetical protein
LGLITMGQRSLSLVHRSSPQARGRWPGSSG